MCKMFLNNCWMYKSLWQLHKVNPEDRNKTPIIWTENPRKGLLTLKIKLFPSASFRCKRGRYQE